MMHGFDLDLKLLSAGLPQGHEAVKGKRAAWSDFC